MCIRIMAISTAEQLSNVDWTGFFSDLIAHLFLAEKFLETIEGNSNYSLLLLHIVDSDSFESMVRLAAAITFKNFVKRQWRVVCYVHFFTIQQLVVFYPI